jgi:hypothetical protein
MRCGLTGPEIEEIGAMFGLIRFEARAAYAEALDATAEPRRTLEEIASDTFFARWHATHLQGPAGRAAEMRRQAARDAR